MAIRVHLRLLFLVLYYLKACELLQMCVTAQAILSLARRVLDTLSAQADCIQGRSSLHYGLRHAWATTAAVAPMPIFATGYHHSRRAALLAGSIALSSSYTANETAR